MFLTLMMVGLAGLLTMTLPWFGRHAHRAIHPGHADGALRFIPSPRIAFSAFALYGAFGNALLAAAHLPFGLAALVALVPTFVVERFAVMPLWNVLSRSAGEASAPLGELIFEEATAVTNFRNGRGMISVVREGRLVQFAARLREDQSHLAVKVGERLRVEHVDSKNERFIVTLLRAESLALPKT
jgi:hypothetical protein